VNYRQNLDGTWGYIICGQTCRHSADSRYKYRSKGCMRVCAHADEKEENVNVSEGSQDVENVELYFPVSFKMTFFLNPSARL
jgi:hypothetical protein